MERIDTNFVSGTLPPSEVGGTPGFFQPGDPGTGAPATQLTADWFNGVQESIVLAAAHFGIALDKDDHTQLLQAIQAAAAAVTLASLTDTTITTPSDGALLQYNAASGKWIDTANTGIDALRKELKINGLMDAEFADGTVRVLNGLADGLGDLSYIDLSESIGYVHDAANALVHNPGSAVTLSATAEWQNVGAGMTFPGDGISYALNRAARTVDTFAGDVSVETTVADGAAHSIYFGLSKTSDDASYTENLSTGGLLFNGAVDSWSVGASSGVFEFLYRTTVVFSQNLSAGDVIKIARVGAVFTAYINGVVVHTWAETNSSALRLVTGSGSTTGTIYTSVRWTVPGVGGDMTVTWDPLTATAVPSAGTVVALIEPVDAVVYNTDVFADLRLGSEAWEPVTLEKLYTDPDGYDVVFGDLASFVATGETAVSARLRTANDKHIKVHGFRFDGDA